MGSIALTETRTPKPSVKPAAMPAGPVLKLRAGLVTLLLLMLATAAAPCASKDGPAPAEDLWESANRAYEAGRFEVAKSDYLQLLHSRNYSSAVCYNLGNTWWKLGEKGRAILNFRRALILEPEAADAESNLRFALEQTGQEPPSEGAELLERRADLYPCIASIGFWTAVFGAAVWAGAHGRLRGASRFAVVLGIAGLLFGGGLTLWVGRGDKDPHGAIVLPGSVDLKIGPAHSARIAETVGEGQQVAVLNERGEWIQCRSQAGVIGWLPNSTVERIVP